MAIIDKRKSGKNQSADNRQRFIKRYKKHIKKAVDSIGKDGSITDVQKDRKIKIPAKDLNEPDFNLDPTTGKRTRVLPGNKDMQKGDQVQKPRKGAGGSGSRGSQDGEGEDDFTFILTKEEFLDIFFSDMELPNFIKESMKDTTKYKYQRSGYVRDGIPARMDLLKTFQQSLARRIATRVEGEPEPRFLDDVDLRYKHFVKKPFPIVHARVFFMMDVSASMSEWHKLISKKFFLLLYLFLTREYKKVEVTFIRHTHTASEVTEHEFFYSKESGGTVVSTGLNLINTIIDRDVKLSETNIYVAQSSDGDNFQSDDELCTEELQKLLPKVQYMAYIQVEDEEVLTWKNEQGIEDLMDLYGPIAEQTENFNIQQVQSAEDVYPVLKELFKKS